MHRRCQGRPTKYGTVLILATGTGERFLKPEVTLNNTFSFNLDSVCWMMLYTIIMQLHDLALIPEDSGNYMYHLLLHYRTQHFGYDVLTAVTMKLSYGL